MFMTAAASKVRRSTSEAFEGPLDRAVVLVGGWGSIGVPTDLIRALAATGSTELTVVSNNCGTGRAGDVGELFAAGAVARVITTFPVHPTATAFRDRLSRGEVDVELVPQGTLAERLRAAGAGIGGFFTPTGAGTELAEGRESRILEGREQVFETALGGDVALIRAACADELGNLRFRYAARAFSPLMAMAGRRTIVQADEIVAAGDLAPDDIHLPGVFVDAVVRTES